MKGAYGGDARIFADRHEAGRELAEWFARSRPEGEIIVLGLPRGGVPVAYEVAAALQVPLDVFLVRKLGAPFNPELAIGAVATGGIVVYNRDVLAGLRVSEPELEEIRRREEVELARRERAYRGSLPAPSLADKTVILVDDGIATGATMRAAVEAARQAQAGRIIVAAPTASRQAAALLEQSADVLAVLHVPEPYLAVGASYECFPQVADEQVVQFLADARRFRHGEAQ
jgi:predicted phosphoribosyltransferase